MGRNAIGWKNLWCLTVLAFLRLKPMHPYELQNVIKLTHKDDFLPLKPGSLYNAIDRLVAAKLIEAREISRLGRRPERTVYGITQAGQMELSTWLRELVEKPGPDPVQFYAALSFLPVLEPEDAREQLEKRIEHLSREIERYQWVLTNVTPRAGRLNLIEVEYALALRQAERNWVTGIVAEIGTD